MWAAFDWSRARLNVGVGRLYIVQCSRSVHHTVPPARWKSEIIFYSLLPAGRAMFLTLSSSAHVSSCRFVRLLTPERQLLLRSVQHACKLKTWLSPSAEFSMIINTDAGAGRFVVENIKITQRRCWFDSQNVYVDWSQELNRRQTCGVCMNMVEHRIPATSPSFNTHTQI